MVIWLWTGVSAQQWQSDSLQWKTAASSTVSCVYNPVFLFCVLPFSLLSCLPSLRNASRVTFLVRTVILGSVCIGSQLSFLNLKLLAYLLQVICSLRFISWGWGFSSAVECLPRKRKALGSVPSSEKKKKKRFISCMWVHCCWDTPEKDIGSHYRWLGATMWLLGFELRTSGRAVSVLNHRAISPALK